MKKILLTVALLLMAKSGFSQGIPQMNYQQSFTAAANGTGRNVNALGYSYYKVTYTISGGTVSACNFDLASSPNNVTYTNVTGLTSITCTSDGTSVIVALTTSWVRVEVNTITATSGTPVLTVNVMAWDEVTGGTSTNGLAVSGIAPSATSSGMSVYSAVSSGNTVTTIDASPGQLYGISLGAGANTSLVYVQLFNAASGSVTIGTTAPLLSYDVPAGTSGGGNNPQIPIQGAPFSTALSWACTTARSNSTGASSPCDINLFYK